MSELKQHTIQYGTTEIEFQLGYSDRKTLGISVYPDTSVRVTAPVDADLDKVYSKVEKRARWIVKQQDYFESFLPKTPPREYVSGETHRYLGRQYRLKVVKSKEEDVKMKAGRLYVFTTKPRDRNRVKRLLSGWYKSHAEKRFRDSFEKALLLFKSYNISTPPLFIQRLKSRWGSCTPKGRIILNPEIIKAPSRCIDYVVIHELCHLVHHNHSKQFYQIQSKIMPDWEKWKERLERVMV